MAATHAAIVKADVSIEYFNSKLIAQSQVQNKKTTEIAFSRSGGERGIRTPGTVARTPHFECGPIDHSGTLPSADAKVWIFYRYTKHPTFPYGLYCSFFG